jgi:hypothetical protein
MEMRRKAQMEQAAKKKASLSSVKEDAKQDSGDEADEAD